jgi:hypothetical protein
MEDDMRASGNAWLVPLAFEGLVNRRWRSQVRFLAAVWVRIPGVVSIQQEGYVMSVVADLQRRNTRIRVSEEQAEYVRKQNESAKPDRWGRHKFERGMLGFTSRGYKLHRITGHKQVLSRHGWLLMSLCGKRIWSGNLALDKGGVRMEAPEHQMCKRCHKLATP